MVTEQEEFLRWWWEQEKKYPKDFRPAHVAQAAYAAWCARAEFVREQPADITITNLDCLVV
jgi:hypothetical protein